MHLRPIHLTSKSRIERLNRQYGIAIPVQWLGRVLFEMDGLSPAEMNELQNAFKPYKRYLLICDERKGTVLFNPEPIESISEFSGMPEWLQSCFETIASFLKTSDLPVWRWQQRVLDFNRAPLIMGILNVTPDSFSDGGRFLNREQALRRALQMVNEGADMIDIGGESTRPGAEPVSAEEEIERVIPVIEAIRRQSDVLISVDTYKSSVAEQALRAGADMVNDISGAQFDANMVSVVRQAGCPLIVMHIKGEPRNMQKNPYYEDAVGEIYAYFEERIRALTAAGIEMLAIDPGIGFGKRVEDNLQLLRDLKDFTFLNRPILIGTSRKSFIGAVLNKETDQRLFGSLATQLLAVQNGAQIVRVHDVAATADVLRMHRAILEGQVKRENENG